MEFTELRTNVLEVITANPGINLADLSTKVGWVGKPDKAVRALINAKLVDRYWGKIHGRYKIYIHYAAGTAPQEVINESNRLIANITHYVKKPKPVTKQIGPEVYQIRQADGSRLITFTDRHKTADDCIKGNSGPLMSSSAATFDL